MTEGRASWWREAVVYQVYPRSFADGDGDGVGDLEGIRARLDHLAWLGVDALWLSPIFRSPMADFGYDVADHCDVDPVFGDLGSFDRLLADAHARGLRVLLDWVPNHTSSEHPWFRESAASRTSPRRDWYVWRDGRDGGPPNNWLAAFGGPAWTLDETTGQWYLHLFLPEQPDLNWGNPEVREAMHGTLRFWLDRGVDGFRVDVVHCLGKDEALPDMPPELAHVDRVGVNDEPVTHELLRGIRRVVDAYPGERVLVGEVSLRDTAAIARYYGEDDELHLSFNFLSLDEPWTATAWTGLVATVGQELGAVRAWPTWVLSNHDDPRARTRLGGPEARARAAAVLLLTLRGTPVLYQGEELGLEDADVPPARRIDPGGRDGCRAPIPWEREPPHGWPGAAPWLPWPPDPCGRSVEAQRADPGSFLHLVRRLLATRRASEALRLGALELVDAPRGVLAYERRAGDDVRLVLVGFADAAARVPLSGAWRIELASDRADEGEPFDGLLGPDRALVLRPASG
ncbi:MAG: alpha-amylase family glycosyl hydrolase [Thermoleophilia bacterium]